LSHGKAHLAGGQPASLQRKEITMSNERVEPLTVAECRELRNRHRFGRFSWDSVGVLPSIVPVNYLLDEDKIVIRTNSPPHSAVPRSRSRWMASTKPTKSAGACRTRSRRRSNRRGQTRRIAPDTVAGLAPPGQPPLCANQPESGHRHTHKYRRPPLELVGVARPATVHWSGGSGCSCGTGVGRAQLQTNDI
jgi:hypothetical protein